MQSATGLRHPEFGCGVVVGKRHANRIEVAFGRGVRRVLRENMLADACPSTAR
jgi:hypothetical protein